ncbi:MAG: polymerase PolC-type [Planctomycetota bacterium]|jgi:DNA polymerase III subunit epsilon
MRDPRELDYIAFDLETTGLHPVGSRIVEIAAIRFSGDGQESGRFEQLIDPGCPIPPQATGIHGITDAAVAGQPDIDTVLPEFLRFVGPAPVAMIAHNAPFDVGFISCALGRLQLPPPPHPVLDTWPLARRRLQLPNYKLETIGRSLGLIEREEHRALADTVLLKDVFLHLLQVPPPLQSEDELFALAGALRFEPLRDLLQEAPRGFELLWLAVARRQVVSLVYQGGSKPGIARHVTPLGLAESSGQIYLTALCHESQIEKSFRVDRIASYRLVD